MAPVFFWFFLAVASYLILVFFVVFPVLPGEGIPADLCVLLFVLVVLVVALSTLVVKVTFLVVLALMVHVIY